jgi:hypothetical protein
MQTVSNNKEQASRQLQRQKETEKRMVVKVARNRINLSKKRKKQLLKKEEKKRNVGLLKNVCVFPE